MASIINQVSFNNFFNYSGSFEDNEYDFSEGVNIVVADNGTGKSKFFNAFMWLFEDFVWDSERKIKRLVKDFAVKIVSDKAKSEANLGDTIECGIKIQYSDNRFRYQITKSLRAKKLGESLTDPSHWQIFINEMEVSKRDILLLTYHPVYDDHEKNIILNKLIQQKLRPYSLFQGEEVDKLIDFSNPKAINEAVTTLTNINKYNEFKNLTDYIFKRAEDSLTRKTQSSSQDTAHYDRMLKDREDLREKLSNEEEKYKRFKISYDENKKDVDDLEAANTNATQRKVYEDKIKDLQSALKQIKDEYENLTSKINSRFFDGNFAWMGFGCEKIVESFKNNNISYIEKHVAYKLEKLELTQSNRVSLLPSGSPDPITVRTMLEKEHCYVCNREAPKGSPAHNHLTSLLERPSKKQDIEIFKNDLSAFFSDIQLGSQPFISRMSNIPDSIKQTRLREEELNRKIKNLQDKIKEQRDKRSNLIIGEEDAELSDVKAIMSQYKGAITRTDRAKNDLEISTEKLSKIHSDLKRLEDEIGKIDIADVPAGYKTNYAFASDLKNAAERTKFRIYNEMLGTLEKHANTHFKSLIKYSDLTGGELKFIGTPTDTIEFSYVDKKGNDVAGASEGFQRMKVLSVLMAIISVNKTGYEYPLLADAPLSAFGQNFIRGFFEETALVFPQSILLIKDLYDKDTPNKLNKLGTELLTSDNVKTLFVNDIPKGLEQVEIYTTKKKLK